MKNFLLLITRICFGALLSVVAALAAVTGIAAFVGFIMLLPVGLLLIALGAFLTDCVSDVKRWARR